MKKKIIIAISIFIVLLIGIYTAYSIYSKYKTPVTNAVTLLPSDASIIIKIANPLDNWNELKKSTTFNNLNKTEFIGNIDDFIKKINSLYIKDSKLEDIVQDIDLYCTVHFSESKINYSYLIQLPYVSAQYDLEKIIKNKSKYSFKEESFKNSKFVKMTSKNNTLFYTYFNGVFAITTSQLLIEDIIRNTSSNSSLLNNTNFKKISKSAINEAAANIYVKFDKLPLTLKNYIKSDYFNVFKEIANFSDWNELDLICKDNFILLNGISLTNSDKTNYLTCFENQTAQEIEIQNVIPNNCNILYVQTFSDFKTYIDSYKKYNKNLAENNIEIKNEYGISIDQTLYDIIGNQVAIAVCPPSMQNQEENIYYVVKTKDIAEAIIKLKQLSKNNLAEANYKGFDIYNINIPNLINSTLNKLYPKCEKSYVSFIQDFVVFGRTAESVKVFINSFTSQNTLSRNEEYVDFNEYLSNTANIFIYSNLKHSTPYFKKFVNDDNKIIDEYSNIGTLGLQINSSKNGEFYTNIIIENKNSTNNNTQTNLTTTKIDWKTKLDTGIVIKPIIIKDHSDNTYNIFVQDLLNQIYLIDKDGEILFKKQLKERIIGNAYEIDYYKNNKVQIIFNTLTQLHIIDKNGSYIEKYPVKLPKKATNSLALFDYDNNKDYRILIACEDKNVYNYSKEGKLLVGWEKPKTKNIVKKEIEYFSVNSKDFIVITDIDGNITFVGRRGEKRVKVQKTFNVSNNKYCLKKEKTLENSSLLITDTSGIVYQVYFNGVVDTINIGKYSKKHSFNILDLDNDGNNEYILLDKNVLKIIDKNKKMKWNFEFRNALNNGFNIYKFPNNETKLGCYSSQTNEIYLFNSDGSMYNNFPLEGNSDFTIYDINRDGILDLITLLKNDIVKISLN